MRSSSYLTCTAALLALTVSACQSDPGTGPQLARTHQAALGSAPLACDFTSLRQAATAFFTSASDPVFPIIDDVELTWLPGGTPAADAKAFDGMARLAEARGTADQRGTGDDGEGVIKGFIGCTSSTAIPVDVDSLDVAIDQGLLEVRGTTSDPSGPVTAFDAVPGSRTPANPLWGAETPSWPATLGQRTLLFGYERPVSSFTIEPPVLNQGTPFPGFELSSFPTGLTFPASSQLTAGICIDPFVFGLSRLLHNAPTSQILPLITLSFCTGNGSASPGSPAGIFKVGGVGGSLSGLSPSGAVLMTPRNDQIIVVQQPSDGIVNQPIAPVQFRAQTQLGTPIGGVLITITLKPSGRTATATTQNDGTATFANIRIPVAGFYTLTASGTLAETPVPPVVTRTFRIRA